MTALINEGTALGNGRYVLERRLGKGGAATVWLAEDEVLGRPVAVKVLSEALADDESWLARFTREARIVAGLSHPNLVSVYDFAAEPERPYIVMAHMPGGSLWDLMQEGGRADPERLAEDVLAALDAIHSAGIIHRDVKPGNVLFDAAGKACLTDFGVARPEDATSLTQTGHIPGTAKFMAPELWQGHPADERSDLYAAGVVLRQAVGDDASPELHRLIDDLTAEDPADRPPSASAALLALGEPPPAAPDPFGLRTPEEPTPRRVVAESDGRPHRLAALAGLAVLAVVAAIALAQALGGDGDADQSSSGQGSGNTASNEGSGNESSSGPSDSSGEGEGSAPPPEEVPSGEEVPTGDGEALNDQGYQLLQAGDAKGAVPILKRAVKSYPADSTDINYAYALYNYGDALVQAGKPEKAIPILEKRMTFDDGQLDEVQDKLDEALAAAGEED